VRYCSAGCHDDLTAQRIPLKPVSASGQWLYECPKCKTTYQVADPPLPQPANWNPLA
jgi:hypothetical protein